MAKDVSKFRRVATPASVAAKQARTPEESSAPKTPVASTNVVSAPGPRYTTKCIYFPDKQKLQLLEGLIAKYPRASISTLVAQMLDPLAMAIKELPDGQRQVKFEVHIWI